MAVSSHKRITYFHRKIDINMVIFIEADNGMGKSVFGAERKRACGRWGQSIWRRKEIFMIQHVLQLSC